MRDRTAAGGTLTRLAAAGGLAAPLVACNASPSQNILGAFFPSWLICAAAGLVLAAVVRQLCVVAGLERHLLLAPLVYVCFALSTSLLLWLLLSGGWP